MKSVINSNHSDLIMNIGVVIDGGCLDYPTPPQYVAQYW